MPPPVSRNVNAKTPPTDYQKIAAQWAKAKRIKDAQSSTKGLTKPPNADEARRTTLEGRRKLAFEHRSHWTVGFWIWLLSVIVIIDALRYDFTVPVEDTSKTEVYHNAFPFLYESAVQSPNNAFLLPFIADPPTSTLQRLKGLTTGTLPTFIDLGSNFAGTAIEEDNILMQLREHGKRIVHLGDDTWTSLFPDYFQPNLSRAYDSFNVWDLHTVDNGVLEHIFPLMKPDRTSEWDITIGHLLGVDHAGHRYGPNHPAMTAKLQQMDGFIRQLAESIEKDTLLVVMGDHGMDEKGDHGGESDDEVEAALWMYSKEPVFGRTQVDFATPPATAKIRPVNQIDLVPTLALLLGIPIPFNNLGRPIEEAFAGSDGNAWDRLAAASSVTSAGIRRYQASYFKARGLQQNSAPGSPASLWKDAEYLVNQSTNPPKWDALYTAYTTYQEETLKICKDLWARFNVPNMILGIAVMALGVVVLLLYVSRDDDEDFAVLDDVELDFAEKTLELQGVSADADIASYKTLTKSLVKSGVLSGLAIGFVSSAAVAFIGSGEWLWAGAATAIGRLAPMWIGYSFRGALLLSAGYWTLDAASNNNWLTSISETTFKTIHVSIAQVVLALALVAGSTAFLWAPPCISILTTSTNSRQAQVTVLGYGNANGARYLLLPVNIYLRLPRSSRSTASRPTPSVQ
ncbi:hypothetical protein ONZ43_g6131 [Nemania bipapillata]|uniref:Uncharacterized protein n=1 Tax=Nemania bipapillata TaxID=110536 RepID=A0ACC2I2T3_9PEZI|nr:hypothetical protein ONZ43_g6131 [Nemania bipapillata]